jgi:DNA repair protein RecO (recombination protein O)
MRSFKTEGIVIKRRNYSEADRIVTIFSKNHGKMQIKAAGVRRITSRRSPHIELLNYSVFSLYQGKSLPVLTEIAPLESFSELKKDLNRIGMAYHICELIDGLCAENQENFQVFDLLMSTLKKLSIEEDLAQTIYDFEIKLLTVLGFLKHNYSSTSVSVINTRSIIEEILERRLKTLQILPQLS